jgi:phenylacetate-CoA ligase
MTGRSTNPHPARRRASLGDRVYPRLYRGLILPALDACLRTRVGPRLREYERSQWLPAAELARRQDAALARLVDHAYRSVPYYRRVMEERGLAPADVRTVADLVKLPILTRADIRAAGTALHSRDLRTLRAKRNSTGGTTGEPLQYLSDWDAWSADWACLYRGWGFAGHRLGDRLATLAGSSLVPEARAGLRQRLRNRLERNLPLSVTSLTPELARRYAERLAAWRPRVLRGYPTALYVFARHVTELGLRPPPLTAVLTTAEMLQPQHRAVIEAALQAPVYDGYGCRDGGANAMECDRHTGLHLAVERAVYEFLDDEGRPGRSGRIVLTDLHNHAMPFIRYEVGDRGVLADAPCPCGRGLPLLARLEGRTTDVLSFAGGVTLSGPAATLMFRETGFLQYQLRQTARDRLELLYVPGAEDSSAGDLERVLGMLRAQVGAAVTVAARAVADIPPTRAGKRRFIVSECDDGEGRADGDREDRP